MNIDPNLLNELIEFVKNASQVVWDALIRQNYSDAIVNLVWVVFLIALIFGLAKLALFLKKKAGEEDDNGWNNDSEPYVFGAWLSGVMAVFLTPVVVGLFCAAIQRFINPNYYAILEIIKMIGK